MEIINYPDTNILIRYFTKDNIELFDISFNILTQTSCFVSELVIAETIYILENHYKLSKVEAVCPVIELLTSVNIISNEYLLDALSLYINVNLSFYDCLILKEAKFRKFTLKTFDAKLLKEYRK